MRAAGLSAGTVGDFTNASSSSIMTGGGGFDYFKPHDPTAALLGFAQTLTALDLFKLQRQLQQTMMMQGVMEGAAGYVNGGGGASESAKTEFNLTPVQAPGEQMEWAKCEEFPVNSGLVGDEKDSCNPLNLHRCRSQRIPSVDSSDSERNGSKSGAAAARENDDDKDDRDDDDEPGENVECYDGGAYRMEVMNAKSGTPVTTTTSDDKFKSDCHVTEMEVGDDVQAAVVVVNEELRRNDRRSPAAASAGVVVSNDNDDPDCVKHEAASRRTTGVHPSSSSTQSGAVVVTSASFTIEHLIGRRT